MSLFDRFAEGAGRAVDLAAAAVDGIQKARRGADPGPLETFAGRQPVDAPTQRAQAERLREGQPAGVFTDNFFELYHDYLQRPVTRTGANAEEMLARVAHIAPVAAVLTTQQNGVGEYCTPQVNEQLPGFRVGLRDDFVGRRAPSKAAQKKAADLARWITHCGVYGDVGQLTARPNFEILARQVYADSFRYDAGVIQIVPERFSSYGGDWTPARMVAMDGRSIRLAAPPADGRYVPDDEFDAVRYVQLDRHQRPVAGFTQRQLACLVTNPRTDLELGGYGISKVEMLIEVVTSYLYAHGHNKRYFERGTNIRGVMAFDGEAPPKDARRAFERYWKSLISGVENAHNTPVLWGTKPSWIPFGNSNNRDMEFSQWLDFLLKLMCSICQIDPAEINFTFGNHGQSGAMGSASVSEKIAASRNRWLRPWLRSFAYLLNTHVVWQLDPDFELQWTGFDVESVDDTHKRRVAAVQHWKTVDEARAEEDLPPLPEGKGEVILNPTWLQATQAQGADEPPEGAGAGPEGPDPDPEGPDPDPEGEARDAGEDPDPGGDDLDEAALNAALDRMFGGGEPDHDAPDDTDRAEKALTPPGGDRLAFTLVL